MFIVLMMHNNVILLTIVMTIVDRILMTASMMAGLLLLLLLLLVIIAIWWYRFAAIIFHNVFVIVTVNAIHAMTVCMFVVDRLDFTILRHVHLSFETFNGYVKSLCSRSCTGRQCWCLRLNLKIWDGKNEFFFGLYVFSFNMFSCCGFSRVGCLIKKMFYRAIYIGKVKLKVNISGNTHMRDEYYLSN